MSETLQIRPIGYHDAMEFVAKHHRHHSITAGQKFAIAAYVGDSMCGVAVCCRPVSRMLDDGKTLEVARLCTDGTKNACSKLYGACARVAKDMGYAKIITYILESEPGTSLKAAGWTVEERECGGGEWSRNRRKREIKAPISKKQRWGKKL